MESKLNTINKLDKNLCTGCGACYNICPKNAIEMKADKDGFLQPVIDDEKCINCGLCASICPQLSENVKFNQVRHAYGIKCKDNVRNKCSSGGAFGAIARWAISEGGVVFGAAYTDDFKGLVHVAAKDEETLQKLYKSKYFQSDTNISFREVKNLLENTRAPVVFAGCPCQVSGLKSYLRKEYKNLVTIDILCHGVVSPAVYKQFIEEFFGDVDSPISNVDFRSKRFGWACNVLVEAKDGTERVSPYKGDYFNSFLWGYSQRNACFECKYARPERVADITLGDFWGIDGILPKMNDKKGVSLMLSNTEIGDKVIKNLKPYIQEIEECDYQKVLNVIKDVNWALRQPGVKPENHDAFFYRLSRGDTIAQALRYASNNHYDVGIFGWWFEDQWTNYGSTLTYYALMEYVSSLGLSVCMLTSPFHKKENASDFVKKHGYIMSKTYKFDQFYKHNENIDTFLIGSDQLWFYNCYKTWGYSLFLDFAKNETKKISYSTSFGHKNPHIPDSEIPKLKQLLSRFDAISTREIDGVDIMKNMFGLEAVQAVDPVFIVDYKNWEMIAADAKRKTEGDFIFTYMLDPTDDKLKALKHFSNKLGMKVVSMTDKQYQNNEKLEMLKDFGPLKGGTIEELIYHFMNAKYVLTDSYHGSCFSILFQKNFTGIINAKRGVSRFDSLDRLFKVGDRFVTDAKEILNKDHLLSRPEYNIITPLVKKESARSKAWLASQLLNVPVKNEKLEMLEEPKNAITPPKPAENPHARTLNDIKFLHYLGYNVGRWLKDNGITNISVYCDEDCLDLFEEFLIAHQFDEAITIEGYYSTKEFEFKHFQSINFGRVYFEKGVPVKGNILYFSDLKQSFGTDCKVFNFTNCVWRALAYANVFRPLVQFKKQNPNVNILCVNYPVMPPEENRDAREKEIMLHALDYDYVNIKKKLPDTLNVFKEKGYTHDDWIELFRAADSEIDVNGKRKYLKFNHKLKNIENGHRITLGQPGNPEKRVFVFGGCMTFGYGCEDKDTTSSNLQKLFNENGINYCVENYGLFLNYRRKDMYQTLFDLPVQNGDIIIVETWSATPEICQQYFDFLNLRQALYRPHNYGDVFIDYSHVSYIGQKLIANMIYEHIKSSNFYIGAKELVPDIDVSAPNVFGIPNNLLTGGGSK